MKRSFHLAVAAGHAGLGIGVVFGIHRRDATVGIFFTARTFDNIGILQTHFLTGSHTEIFLGSVFHKVVAFHPEFAAEGYGVAAGLWVFGIIDGFHHFHLPFGIVGDDEFDGIQHGRHTCGAGIQIFAHGTFQQSKIVEGIVGGITDFVNKLADGFRRIAATAEGADGRHTRIIPTVYNTFFYQYEQVALAHERIVEVQFVEFVLTGAMVVQVLVVLHPVYQQIVQRTVRYEFERAERVRHAFEIVALAMGEIVHGIGLPFVAGAVVRMVYHTVDNGVAEVHVRTGHVNFGTQHHLAFGNFARIHL